MPEYHEDISICLLIQVYQIFVDKRAIYWEDKRPLFTNQHRHKSIHCGKKGKKASRSKAQTLELT